MKVDMTSLVSRRHREIRLRVQSLVVFSEPSTFYRILPYSVATAQTLDREEGYSLIFVDRILKLGENYVE